MKTILSKQAKKYLDKIEKSDKKVYAKLLEGINDIENLDGDIKKLAGRDNEYRYKIFQYRIIFAPDFSNNEIFIKEIGSRGDIYK